MSGFRLTRRTTLSGLGGIVAAGLPSMGARAAQQNFNIVCNDAHQAAATVGPGGNVIAAWEQAHAARVNWITLDVPANTERVLREASLPSTSIDMGYIIYMTQRALKLMEPLDDYLKTDPIDGSITDFPPALIEQLKVDGTLRGLPIRSTIMGFVYNEAILQERGVTSVAPRSFEELAELFRKCTFTRADGSKVYGLIFFGTQNLSDVYADFARTFNGDYILPDRTLVANQDGNIKSLQMMKKLYEEGVYSPQCFTNTGDDLMTYMANGRAAFVLTSVTNVTRLNTASNSRYAGSFKVLQDWPMAEEFVGKAHYSPLVQSWSIVMPHNLPNARKPVTWSLMKNLVSVDSVVRQTLNGNGPARASALNDPRLAALPYKDTFIQGLKYGRVDIPSIPNAVQIADIFVQASQAAILGRTPIKQAMDAAVAQAKPLI